MMIKDATFAVALTLLSAFGAFAQNPPGAYGPSIGSSSSSGGSSSTFTVDGSSSTYGMAWDAKIAQTLSITSGSPNVSSSTALWSQSDSQLALPGYHTNSTGKLVIESKKSLQDRGEKSPDDADAFLLTFSRNVGAGDKSRFAQKRYQSRELQGIKWS